MNLLLSSPSPFSSSSSYRHPLLVLLLPPPPPLPSSHFLFAFPPLPAALSSLLSYRRRSGSQNPRKQKPRQTSLASQ